MDPRVVARVGLVMVSAAILQRGILAEFRLWNVTADLLLLVALAAAMIAGPERGAVVGFAAGLLVDLQVHRPFGLTALTFCLAAYLLGFAETLVVRGSRNSLIVTGFVATALAHIGLAILGELVGVSAPSPGRVLTVAVVAGVWNGLLTPGAVRVMRWAWQGSHSLRLTHR